MKNWLRKHSRMLALLLVLVMSFSVLTGCQNASEDSESSCTGTDCTMPCCTDDASDSGSCGCSDTTENTADPVHTITDPADEQTGFLLLPLHYYPGGKSY